MPHPVRIFALTVNNYYDLDHVQLQNENTKNKLQKMEV